jgi:integrase
VSHRIQSDIFANVGLKIMITTMKNTPNGAAKPKGKSSRVKELGEPFTAHGFRSSLRDWVSEETDHQSDVAEAALAHHPHIHMIVPGGGISRDGTRWISARPAFLLPGTRARRTLPPPFPHPAARAAR